MIIDPRKKDHGSIMIDPNEKKKMRTNDHIEHSANSATRPLSRKYDAMELRFQGFDEKPCPTKDRIR